MHFQKVYLYSTHPRFAVSCTEFIRMVIVVTVAFFSNQFIPYILLAPYTATLFTAEF